MEKDQSTTAAHDRSISVRCLYASLTIYDQPIVLNRRQAGVAIEGALKQKIIELQRVAVDTHGFTHFALAAAKLLGFDLSPRLAGLASRKLYLPQGVKVPTALEPMVERVRISRLAREGWDGMLQLVSSLKAGYGSAATILDRHGSAARGTPVFECGTLLGKVLRSLFLADYLTKPNVRRNCIDCCHKANPSTFSSEP